MSLGLFNPTEPKQLPPEGELAGRIMQCPGVISESAMLSIPFTSATSLFCQRLDWHQQGQEIVQLRNCFALQLTLHSPLLLSLLFPWQHTCCSISTPPDRTWSKVLTKTFNQNKTYQ